MEAIIGLIALVIIGIPLVPFVMSLRMYSRLARQQRTIDMLGDRLARIEAQLREAKHETRDPRRAPAEAPAPRPAPPAAVLGPIVVPPDVAAPESLPPDSRGFRLQAEEGAPPDSRGFRLQAEETSEEESLETQIGTRWLLYAGVVAIIIGIAYFEKLAIERGWIGETARVLQGAAAGLALVFGGTRFVRSGYSLYGQMISGCGAAILYVSTYAAFQLYHLIDRPVAFALMIGITVMAAALADRQRSQGLAVLAVGGGFATPFLVRGTADAQVALFTYDAILVAATMFLARRHDWPLLNVISYVFTLLTVAAWADRYYTRDKSIRTEAFITLFCAMFLYILRETRRSKSPAAQIAAMFLWTAPVAYYLASLIVLAPHEMALLVWFVAMTLAGGLASAAIGATAGVIVWTAVTLPFLLWTNQQTGAQWRAPGLATAAGIYAIALGAQLRGILERDAFRPSLVIWLHLNGLLMFAAAYFLIEPVNIAITGTAAGTFAVWNGLIAGVLLNRRRDYALHFGALAFTLLSIAIALQFDGPAVTVGWAAEGAVIVALGLHERRDWLRAGGVALFAIAFGNAIALLLSVAPINQAVLFNPRALSTAFVIALCYVVAWLHHRDAADGGRRTAVAAALVVAQVLTLALLTSEITAFWEGRYDRFAKEVMLSVTWAAYSTALVVIGLRRRYAPIRYFAMLVLGVTTLKVFFLDMAELERIYRVLSVIGLGILLLLTSWLYQRTRTSAAGD